MTEPYDPGTDVDQDDFGDAATPDLDFDPTQTELPASAPLETDSTPAWWSEEGQPVSVPENVCCTCAPVDMAPDTTVEWSTPITVNLDGELQTLGTPNVDLDGDGRAETFTGEDGGSIVYVTDANGDGTGESMAVYNTAGQLTAALVLDPSSGQWEPVSADSFQQTVTDPALAPAYTVNDQTTTSPTVSTDPSYVIVGGPQESSFTAPEGVPAPETAVIGPADYSGNPAMVLFDSANQMSQRASYDMWSMAYGDQPVPSDNPADIFARISTDPNVSPELQQAASTWLDTLNDQTKSLIEGM